MGVKVSVGAPTNFIEVSNYEVSESSTPIIGGDSSGAVGVISVNVPRSQFPQLNYGKPLRVTDTIRGYTSGLINEVTDDKSADITLSGPTDLARFVIDVTAQPHVGTVESAFKYYCSLAGVSTEVLVDASIANNEVALPGFQGELWTHMKEFALSVMADITYASGITVLAPVRRFEALRDVETDSVFTWSDNSLALQQEVIWYQTDEIVDARVYPPPGGEEQRVISVNAGETTTYTLAIQASVSRVQQPIMVEILPPGGIGVSAYSVVGNDDVHITPEAWASNGGLVSVEIGPDTRTLILTVTGATNLPSVSGEELKSFRLALSAGTSDSTYPAIYIHGSGVSMIPNSVIVNTGATLSDTSQEMAPTIDSVFINTLNDAYRVATMAATRHSPTGVGSLSQSGIGVNSRGFSGFIAFASYQDFQFQNSLNEYSDIQSTFGAMTYQEAQDEIREINQPDYEYQVFGNIAGARIFDRQSGHYYRVRDARTSWGIIDLESDMDTTLGDVQRWFSGQTYGDVDGRLSARTYRDVTMLGANA